MKSILRRCVGLFSIVTVAMSVGCNTRQAETGPDPQRAYFDARATLRQAAEDPDPKVRTNALEALAQTEGPAAGAIMMQSLRDEREPVRFAAALAIGDVRYGPAKPILLTMIKESASHPKLMCSLIYALHRLGDDTYTGELGSMLHHKDKWVRATTAMIMGRIGEPSAIEPLKYRQRMDHDPVVILQIVEALARLGDNIAAVRLEAYARSRKYEDSIIAIKALGLVANPRSALMLRRLMNDRRAEPAMRVVAAESLARMGEKVTDDLPRRSATDPEGVLRKARGKNIRIRQIEITSLQTLAILSLAYVDDPQALETLVPLLRSSNGVVRVASAKSLLQLLKAYKSTHRLEAKKPIEKPAEKKTPTTMPAKAPRLHTAGGKD